MSDPLRVQAEFRKNALCSSYFQDTPRPSAGAMAKFSSAAGQIGGNVNVK